MFTEAANKIRNEFLILFPEIKLETLCLENDYIVSKYFQSANLPKNLLAYMSNMESLELWTFENVIKSPKELDTLNNIIEALPSILVSLSMKYDQQISDNLNYLLARMSVSRTIYIVKFLDNIQPLYLHNLYSNKDENSKLLIYRLEMLNKIIKLNKIFSYSNFNRIIQILGKKHNEKYSI